MRKLILLIFVILVSSCKSDKNTQAEKEIALLKKENDSLKNIIKNKYLFDHIGFRLIPSAATSEYNDKKFEGDFVIVGYNRNDLVIKGDFDDQKWRIKNSDTLKARNGNYNFSVENGETKEVSFDIQLENTADSKTHDSIITVPYKYLWPK